MSDITLYSPDGRTIDLQSISAPAAARPKRVSKADRSIVAFVSPWMAQAGIASPETFHVKDFMQTYGDGRINMVWVYSSVHCYMSHCQQIPLAIYLKDGRHKGKMSQEDSPEEMALLDLLEHPNPDMLYSDFVEAGLAYKKLGGNFFIGLEGIEAQDDMVAPTELWPLRPDKMRIVPSMQKETYGQIAWYAVDIGGPMGNWPSYRPWEMIHIKEFAPTNSYWGQTPLSVAMLTIMQDYYERTFMTRLFQAGTIPSGVLSSEFLVDDAVMKRMKKQFVEMNAGLNNMHSPMVLENGLKWQQVTVPPKDLEFLEARKMNKLEIVGGVYGLPPAAVGDYSDASLLANADVQDRVVWNVAHREMRKMAEVLDNKLLPRFLDPRKFMLAPNVADIPALHEDEGEKAKTYSILVGAGWPEDRARERIYPDEQPFPKQITEETAKPDGTDLPPMSEGIGKTVRRRGSKFVLLSSTGKVLGTHPSRAAAEKQELAIRLSQLRDKGKIKKATTDEEAALAKSFLDSMKKLQGVFEDVMIPAFKRWGKAVSKAAKESLSSIGEHLTTIYGLDKKDPKVEVAAGKVIDDVEWNDEQEYLSQALKPAYTRVAEKAVDFVNEAMAQSGGVEVVFDLVSPSVMRKLDLEGLRLAKSVTGTVKEDVRQSLIEGIAEGKSIPDMSADLQEIVEGYRGEGQAYRAERVARTETIRASNAAALEVYAEAGVERVKWLDTRDLREDQGNTEGICWKLGRMDPVPVGEDFVLGISQPPAHPNCRCALVPVVDFSEELEDLEE